MRKKKRITALLTSLAMLFTCAISNTSLKADTTGESIYTTKGEATKIYASAFAQNTSDDWAWMDIGDTATLAYQDVTNLSGVNSTNALAKVNGNANFGINISDGNLAVGDSSTLKFHIGTVTIKATGYDDVVVNLNKDYSESYTAEKASWGTTGNTTQVLLNDYIPKDTTAKAAYLQKITSVKADITLSDYQYTKAAPVTPTNGKDIYTTKGQKTDIYADAFAQNTSDDWTWMGLGDAEALLYKDVLNMQSTGTSAFDKVNSTANFGINVVDNNLGDGDSNILKFHVGTVTVKANGYDDIVVNLNKDYSEQNSASKVSWGINGNNTQILLNDYLPKDATAKVNYLKKVTSVSADITLSDYQYIKAPSQESEFPAGYKHPTTMRGLSSMDLVKDMKVGWNLGNTLDSKGGETGWGNPKTSMKMIDEIKKAGFNTVRIPVRWDENYTDANDTINSDYMKRVETVVNYALANDMYAIINIHHNKIQGEMNAADEDAVINEGSLVWKQIADHFKDYSDKLIFETINEPRNDEDWTGKEEYYKVVNDYNAKMLSVIRATGENNAKRLVMMPTYCASSDYAKVSAMVVPNDPNVAVSIHAYIPYNFAMNVDTTKGAYSTFGDTDKAFIDKTFRLLDKTFVQKGIPVVLGEFAATNKNNLQDRVNYAKYYAQTAASYGIPCCWWDNNVAVAKSTDSGTDVMGIFDRKTLKWVYPEIAQALLDGYSNPKNISNYDDNLMFSGTATSSSWGQAVSFNYGLDFVDDDFSNKLAIAVDYKSTNAPQLVLRGDQTATNWVRVSPSITKTNGTTSTAYFTLNDMISAYKKALSNYDTYGKVLPGIQSIIVGDQGADLTVTKVYKIYVQKLEQKVSDSTISYTNNSSDKTEDISVTLPTDLQKVVDAGISTSTMSYKSSDETVAKVSQDGKITAVGDGKATITTAVTAGESKASFETRVIVKNSNITLLGDVNNDGVINVNDLILLKRYLKGASVNIDMTAADLNGDGTVNVLDVILMKKYLSGKITSFPASAK
ncbi:MULTISPECIES: cellulase family glycosylhydrolase [Clostridium]|uniref:cellulase family glycosylhydrolase n=1 Tax=Clostridium TaxID=1485 RepID=UPI000824F8AB|nr:MULTISPECIES: cellulase family glycosylhydrolase [Clostridium]PJI07267.1 endoglucanase [Clostridium sp. CT7]